MTQTEAPEPKRRNRNYEDTHQILIEKAAELISISGAENLSVCALARATGINRTTIYYHFDSREALIAAVRVWFAQERAKWADLKAATGAGIDNISSFVMSNPEIIKLWIDDYISAGDVRVRDPQFDRLVAQIFPAFVGESCDAEVYCVLILTSAFVASRVFKNAVPPHECLERIVSGLRGSCAVTDDASMPIQPA